MLAFALFHGDVELFHLDFCPFSFAEEMKGKRLPSLGVIE
jgi:hypothetical protein